MFSVLPDLDVLFYVHRSISHSLVFLLLVLILLPLLYRVVKFRAGNV
ncbi:MAG: hypothetical protein J7K82_02330 [Thermoproteales archaeon]|nr:hypothetical protein [Thermoproteales archaeon]